MQKSILREKFDEDVFLFTTYFMDIEAHDWNRPPASYVAQKISKSIKPSPIILLHDGDQTRHGSNRSETVKALPLILRDIKKWGI